MIRETENKHNDYYNHYQYEFKSGIPLTFAANQTLIDTDVLIRILVNEFETNLKLFAGYTLEQNWVKP